jgi:predicted nuclease of predicted toxin-antitoxin system
VKLLVDACLSRQLVDGLRTAGHDVTAVADWPEDPGDEAILAVAAKEARVLITRDKDFGTLAVHSGASHQGVLQIRRILLRMQTQICLQVLSAHGTELEAGAIVTVQPGRVRVRKQSQ